MLRILYALTIDREKRPMHLFHEHHFRELLNQAAHQQGTPDEVHLVRKLFLHPRALRVAHETIEHMMEQALPNEVVKAMSDAAAEQGGFLDALRYIMDHWQEIAQKIMDALKMFHVI